MHAARPAAFSRWEADVLVQGNALRKSKSARDLTFALLNFLAATLLLIGSWLLLDQIPALIGVCLSLFLFGCFMTYGMRYFSPSPPATLSQKQRTLLGILNENAPDDDKDKHTVAPLVMHSLRSAGTIQTPSPKTLSRRTTPYRPTAWSAERSSPLPRSPLSVSSDDVITDQSALERFLASVQRNQPGSPSSLHSPGFSDSARTASPKLLVTPYRASPLHSPSLASPVGEFGYLTTQAAEELIEQLQIGPYLDEWTERLRKWLVRFILQPLVHDMEEVTKEGLSMQKPLSSEVTPTTTGVTPASQNMWYQIAQPSLSMDDIIARNSNNPKVQKRIQLEYYMNVLGCSSREYLIQRIKELAKGSCMATFKWNGGGKWKNKEWTSELPTDSQIIIHLFCVFMDTQLPKDPRSPSGKPFTSQYFVVFPDTPDSIPSHLKIYQQHIHPPHFKVVYNKDMWETFQGRNNLFHTLVLFVYCAQTRLDGYLGSLRLYSIGLDKVVAK